ncbi:MAG: hypothetical protein KME10_09035 [Plectolyngbya sp. WJT66-NPBG17]|jgi:predicted RNase H-like nuclease (RuvC/YqgF family)|nr:hypothetical protein [Plectolyngbya sp. WJT66-NPBG17]MBW4524306.1 hypothetical protein [Phormidium tanganyikae FI6-MK23]
MSQVVGWLNEVKDLQQQVKAAQAAEQSAHASADNWRKRYEIEAEQRRAETQAMQNTIAEFRAELDRLKNQPQASETEIQTEIDQLQTVSKLQAKLIEVWSDRNQLAQDLHTEKISHTQTRNNLTTALGDTVDMLSKLKEPRA